MINAYSLLKVAINIMRNLDRVFFLLLKNKSKKERQEEAKE